jgi:anti-sigma regulatory factor (Ser/Thr protein kinase)
MTTRPVSPSAAEKVLQVLRDADVAVVQSAALRLAREAGFDKKDGWEFAIAASEAATNIIKHAERGVIVLRGGAGCLELEALDRGAGIDDVEAVLRDGRSGDHDPSGEIMVIHRRGLGLGLGAIQRLTDELSISPRAGGGTVLVARKFKKGAP